MRSSQVVWSVVDSQSESSWRVTFASVGILCQLSRRVMASMNAIPFMDAWASRRMRQNRGG